MDVITRLAFGEEVGCLRDEKDHYSFLGGVREVNETPPQYFAASAAVMRGSRLESSSASKKAVETYANLPFSFGRECRPVQMFHGSGASCFLVCS
jgi:hypothetical protein